MDHNLEDSLTLEGMDFDHSEDVVNEEDIPLENSGRLDSITMDMDVGEQSHNLMESVNDEVIVSDLIEDPFPFQEYTVPTATSGHNLMIDPHQLNQLTVQHDPGISIQYADTLLKQPTPGSAKSNVVTVKVAQPKTAKRVVAPAPLRQVAIAPKPVPTKPVQYAIAPKPMALLTNKHAVGLNKIPISSSGNVKANTVLAQIGRQLVMVPKKIKLMSSGTAESIINNATSGLQYQMACSSEQAQLMTKGSKPMVKFIQIQSQSSADKNANPSVFTKVASANVAGKARYVMQQKTVPISIGGNKVVQNVKIAGKKKIIAIKSQNPSVQTTQGNVSTKKVVISSNAISNQKVLIRTNAPTATSAAVKDTGSTGQRTQFHPINVPGKGIQYIKLVTNQAAQKQASKTAVPAKNFVFTDSKGNVIQMTAEKVVPSQSQSASIVVQGTATTTKGVVKTVKAQKKLVRIAPVSKALSQTIPQPARSSQSLLAPITSLKVETTAPMTSLPSLSSPTTSPVITATVSLQEFNDMVDAGNGKVQQSYSLANYIDNSRYETNDYTENDVSTGDFSTEYSTEDANQLHDEAVEENVDPDETVDVKPTLQSLISDAVSEERESDNEMENTQEVTVDFESKPDVIGNASFILGDDNNVDRETSHTSGLNNEEAVIIVPGTNYSEKANESLYSDESQSYRFSMEDQKKVPLLSVEAECLPYTEHMLPESPSAASPTADEQTAASLDMRPRKACNCTKSQCLKLYCDCFANGEFCNNCNCNNCHNNLENEEIRQKAIRSCLERNPNAFRPKIGKSKTGGPEIIRRHTKGCNCKRSGCLKNYCECYEAKIACTAMCKCVGCRNVEETLIRRRDAMRLREKLNDPAFRPAPAVGPVKQPCSFMTMEVIEAVCQCLVAAGGEARREPATAVHDVIEEFARCLQDVITASHHAL